MSELFQSEVLVESSCMLGEGPLWLPETQMLYWTDIEDFKIWGWSEQEGASTVSTAAPVGGLARASDECLVGTVNRGFGYVDVETGAVVAVGEPRTTERRALMNDCKCDRAGRLVGGSRHPGEKEPLGKAFVLDRGRIRHLGGEYIVWNGPAFNPSGDRIYYADTFNRKILTAEYNLDEGVWGEPEVFVETSEEEGWPDGMTVDSAGRLWVARWHGWSVACYGPDGALVQEVAVPVPQVASITFGGADMKTGFVTTARTRLDKEAFSQAPLSGHVFAFQTDIAGLEEPVYKD